MEDFIDLYIEGINKEFEKTAWEFWLVQYPSFTEDTFVPFNEYLQSIRGLKNSETNETEQGVYIDQIGL